MSSNLSGVCKCCGTCVCATTPWSVCDTDAGLRGAGVLNVDCYGLTATASLTSGSDTTTGTADWWSVCSGPYSIPPGGGAPALPAFRYFGTPSWETWVESIGGGMFKVGALWDVTGSSFWYSDAIPCSDLFADDGTFLGGTFTLTLGADSGTVTLPASATNINAFLATTLRAISTQSTCKELNVKGYRDTVAPMVGDYVSILMGARWYLCKTTNRYHAQTYKWDGSVKQLDQCLFTQFTDASGSYDDAIWEPFTGTIPLAWKFRCTTACGDDIIVRTDTCMPYDYGRSFAIDDIVCLDPRQLNGRFAEPVLGTCVTIAEITPITDPSSPDIDLPVTDVFFSGESGCGPCEGTLGCKWNVTICPGETSTTIVLPSDFSGSPGDTVKDTASGTCYTLVSRITNGMFPSPLTVTTTTGCDDEACSAPALNYYVFFPCEGGSPIYVSTTDTITPFSYILYLGQRWITNTAPAGSYPTLGSYSYVVDCFS